MKKRKNRTKIPVIESRRKRVKKNIMLTILLLIIIEAVGGIPAPGVNNEIVKSLIDGNDALGFMNSLTGGGLGNMSVTALSITPYITASIILQLMGVVIPSIAEIPKDGVTGERKYKRINLMLAVILAVCQSLAIAIGFGKQGLLISYSPKWVLLLTAIWTLSTAALVMTGEYITEHLFGNGISLILMCNILSGFPSHYMFLFQKYVIGKKIGKMVTATALIIFVTLLMISFVLYLDKLEIRLSMQHSSNIVGQVVEGRDFLPLKVCPGSVIPIIFASTLFSMPSLIASLFGKSHIILDVLTLSNWFDIERPYLTVGAILYIAMVFFFNYFYVNMSMSPSEIAMNLQKSGATIKGIRPGKETEAYIRSLYRYSLAFGAAGLCVVALLPIILSQILAIGSLGFSGTSIIIITGVLLETRDRFIAEMPSRLIENARLY